MAGLATAFGSGAATNGLDDITRANTLFVIGSNTSAQHPLAFARMTEAKKRGNLTLIVADPRVTPVAELADIYLPLRPGSNLALVNSMLHVIFRDKLESTAFITARTEGIEALRESVKNCTPQWAAERTGLEPQLIERAAKAFAAGPDSMTLYCMGVTQQLTGTRTCSALANLTMACGMIGRQGTGLVPLRGQNNVQGSCDMGGLPEVLPGYVPAGSDLARERFEPMWGPFCNEKGLKLTEIMDAAHHGKIKALFIMGENPVLSDPNAAHVRAALEKVELLVVQDIFMTETAELAHVVLPAASYLEKTGTFTNTERRVQMVNKVLDPLPGTRPDWEILADIIRHLGHKASYATSEEVFAELRQVVPSYAGMTYARLRREQGLCWPCPTEDHPGTPILHMQTFSRGNGLFTVNDFPDQPEEIMEAVSDEFPLTLLTGRLSHHYHTGTMTRRSWALEREFPEAFLEMHPEDADRIGVKDNWKVLVRSRRGELVARLRVTTGIRKGTVFLPFHFTESRVNELTASATLDPTVKIPPFKGSAVMVQEFKG